MCMARQCSFSRFQSVNILFINNSPKAGEYWTKMANYTRDTLKVVPTGYWIDMAELASFANGERD